MKQPHIMIVLHQLGQGGVERVALHLANGFARRGNRVSLLVLRPGGALEDLVEPSVERIEPPTPAGPKRGAGLLRFVGSVAGAVRTRQPDVLLSPGNHLHPLVVLAHRRAGAPGCRLALKLTNPVRRPDLGRVANALRRSFFRFAAACADQVLTLSEESRLEAAGIAPRAAPKIRVVDNPYVEEARLSAPTPRTGPPLLLSIGRLAPQKDPLMLLGALAGLQDMPWRLAMLGDGPLRSAIEAKAAALGLTDRIDLPGYVADPAPWFNRAKIFLLSSRYEELPAVLFEALAARCRIVATAASPGIAAVFAGTGSRLVAPGDVDSFRSAIAEALQDERKLPDPGETLSRFSIANGVASHAAALGLL